LSRTRATATTVLLVAIVVGIVLQSRPNRPTPGPIRTLDVTSEEHPPLPPGPTIGEEVLADYADPEKPPRHDLELVSRLLHSYRALVKRHTAKPIGGNADLIDALLGDNPAKQVFLPPDFAHLCPAPDPELLDRWGTPLIVHPIASDRFELRSAGPDKRPYNDDDVLLTP
jgi:hypothetical protein